MVDIHSHILPGIDDGSSDLAESLRMLEIAAESGTTDIVATPHANLEYEFDPAVVAEKLEELRTANPTSVKIHQGCDFHLDYDLIQDAVANPAKFTINGHSYLLIELADVFPTQTIPPILDVLIRAGMTPILTHPERYFGLRGKEDEIKEWVMRGCLVQVTGQSLLGVFGSTARKMSERLLDDQMIHFIASDAHRSEGRTPRLVEARDAVASRAGEETAELLFEVNPRAVLTGETLPKSERPQGRRKSKSWLSSIFGS